MFEKSPKNRKFAKVVFVKNRRFSYVCFFGKSSHKGYFFDILNRKECFLDRNWEV